MQELATYENSTNTQSHRPSRLLAGTRTPASHSSCTAEAERELSRVLTVATRCRRLRGLYAVADQAGDQWVSPQLCNYQHLHVLMLSPGALYRVMLRYVRRNGNTMSTPLRKTARPKSQKNLIHLPYAEPIHKTQKGELLLPSPLSPLLLLPLPFHHPNLHIKNILPNSNRHHPQHRLNILLRYQSLPNKNPTIPALASPFDCNLSYGLANVFAAVLAHELGCVGRCGDEVVDFGG